MNEKFELQGFFPRLRRDFHEICDFYLDEEDQEKVVHLSRFRRGFFIVGRILHCLFQCLAPFRRVLLFISFTLFILPIFRFNFGTGSPIFELHFSTLGWTILLFLLMLELKDKLLAQDELAAGRAVQKALQPETSPLIPNWDVWLYSIPANDVSGDLIDWLQLDGDRHAVALGDVSGKGLPAALFMAKLQAILHAFAAASPSIAGTAKKINETIFRDNPAKHFASLVYMELSPASGKIRWFNAGHPPPLRLDKQSLVPLNRGESALGIAHPVDYHQQETDLAAGEFLLIYSDGVTESQNPAGEFFGLDRLKNIALAHARQTAAAIGESVLADVKLFVADRPRHDDLSLIIIKRR